MSKKKHSGNREAVFPSIVIASDEARRLSALANSNMTAFPRVAHFPAHETEERAKLVADDSDLRGIVRMGSLVRYCDNKTGDLRDVVLVYPHEADIALKRISVLTPVGAALSGLPVGQAIELQMPGRETRSLTVLGVSNIS